MTDKNENPWTVLRTRPVYDNPWINVVEHDVLAPTGKPGIYGVVHAKQLATGVVALDREGAVVLVGQYRFPLGAYSWEIPEGGGNPGETPMDTIKRELQEETGLIARDWVHLQTLHLSNSVTDEVAEAFLAWNLEEGVDDPDGTEELVIRRVPFSEAYQMVMDGEITDAISVAAILRSRLMAIDDALPRDARKLILKS